MLQSGNRNRVVMWASVAILLVLSAPAGAVTTCVDSAASFEAALTDAGTGGSGNNSDNTVRLVAGTFTTSGAPFTFSTASGFALTIEGGYSPTCASQDLAPGLSVLDGGNVNQALSIQTNGTITVRHLTIRNGFHGGSSDGGGARIILRQLQPADPMPTLVFDSNVVANNSSDYSVGGMYVSASAPEPNTPAAIAYIENSLFAGNVAPTVAALSINLTPGSTSYLTNDTFTKNVNTGPASATIGLGGGDPTTLAYVSNTISYGNTASYDYYLTGFQTVQFNNDDYGTIAGSQPRPGSGANLIGIDPQFVASDDFHLQTTSPLLRAGTLTPVGGLPATDIEGNPRSFAGFVDIGAYQDTDVIFANSFDPS